MFPPLNSTVQQGSVPAYQFTNTSGGVEGHAPDLKPKLRPTCQPAPALRNSRAGHSAAAALQTEQPTVGIKPDPLTYPGLAANELQEKLLREARLATSPLQRKLCEAAADGMRMWRAHDCTLGWPVVKGGE